MKAGELRELETTALEERLDETYHELFNLRFQLATRQLDNVRRIRQVRKDIARIKTLLHERRHAGSRVAAGQTGQASQA